MASYSASCYCELRFSFWEVEMKVTTLWNSLRILTKSENSIFYYSPSRQFPFILPIMGLVRGCLAISPQKTWRNSINFQSILKPKDSQ
jgi:hypothetical protein